MLLSMNADIPTSSELRSKLTALSWAQVQELCRKTGAPFTTVWKIRSGETADPRLETVRLLWPELVSADGAPEVPSSEVSDTALPAPDRQSEEAQHAA